MTVPAEGWPCLAPIMAPARIEKAMIAPPARDVLPLCFSMRAPCHDKDGGASHCPNCPGAGHCVPLRDLVKMVSTIEGAEIGHFGEAGMRLV